jgi:hypothetical protein
LLRALPLSREAAGRDGFETGAPAEGALSDDWLPAVVWLEIAPLNLASQLTSLTG